MLAVISMVNLKVLIARPREPDLKGIVAPSGDTAMTARCAALVW